MQPDKELLRQYARAGSEEAFAELVKRHVNLVYSAALRQTGGDSHLARDVAQNVFTDLARKAGSLLSRESLTGWLYTSAFFAAGKLVRTEIRRREREEKFMRDPAHDTAADVDWEKLRPILDAAMHGLKDADREAVLLRYFENRPFAEVGARLGVNENTARMRVERALEKLRALLSQHGITAGAGLASVISANAVQLAPPTLAAAFANTSLAAAGAGASFAIFKFMTLTQIKVGLGAIAVAGAASALVLQHQAQHELKNENEFMRQQIAQLKTENEQPTNRANDAQSLPSEQLTELLRLRSEVGALRSQTNQIAKLRDENQGLQESLLRAGQTHQLPAADPPSAPTPEQEFAQLEMNTAKQSLLTMIMYAQDHGEAFPTNFDQATNYYKSDTLTNVGRFEITYQGSWTNLANPASAIVLREVQPWSQNGKWVKVYGFGDGHVQIHASPNGNFDEYEQQNAPMLKNQ